MKKIIFSISFLVILSSVFSQVPPDYRYVKTWRIEKQFAAVDSLPVDTVHLNFQNLNPIDCYSIANSYNGNLGSPIQSKLYFDRPANADFIFANAYYPYLMNVDHATFYNTKTPFSYLHYISGGTTYRAQDDIKFLFTGNANKKLNMGITLDYMHAIGEYRDQASDRFAGSLFGTYDGEHYSAKALVATNNMKNKENGGLKNPSDIFANYASSIIPVNISGQSNYGLSQFFYHHQYSIGFEREEKVSKDSVRMVYVPVTRFAHTLRFENEKKRYFENTVEKTFYQNTYGTGTQTRDTASLQTLTNNFSVNMAEEFNKWMQFGLTAFIENEVQQYSYLKQDVLAREMLTSSRLGGILSKEQGQRFRYNVLGELCFVGEKIGDFSLEGNMGGFFKLWNDSISLIAKGFVRSDEPSPFLKFYESNHFRWNNDFGKVYRTYAGGTFAIPTRDFSLDVSVENLTRFIYFDAAALPAQYAGNIQVIAANLKKDFHFGKFALENNVVYQLSSKQEVLPLPELTLYHNLYYHDKWFNQLSVQIGTNVRYHTLYYAPAYMPATGQFYSQRTTKTGNYPIVNVYLNCHLKRTRFYAEYYHVNNLLMEGDYFSMPGYPLNPAIFKLGISWNFYD